MTEKQKYKVDCIAAVAEKYSWTWGVYNGTGDTVVLIVNQGSRASRTYRIDTNGIVSVIDSND